MVEVVGCGTRWLCLLFVDLELGWALARWGRAGEMDQAPPRPQNEASDLKAGPKLDRLMRKGEE